MLIVGTQAKPTDNVDLLKRAFEEFKNDVSVDSWKNIAQATFLLVAGRLAEKQIPRLMGEKVELNSAALTYAGAIVFLIIACIGIAGGATQCALVIDKKSIKIKRQAELKAVRL